MVYDGDMVVVDKAYDGDMVHDGDMVVVDMAYDGGMVVAVDTASDCDILFFQVSNSAFKIGYSF